MKNEIKIITSALFTTNRDSKDKTIVSLNDKNLEFTYCEGDALEDFEESLNKLKIKNFYLYKFKKKVVSFFLSFISVVIILFALISSSLYEDLLKKVLFELPFDWTINETISLMFVGLFFFGLIMVPSILDGERSQFKELLQSWFNKKSRVQRRFTFALNGFDKDTNIKLYNFDLLENENFIWENLVPIILKKFNKVSFYIRNDEKKVISKRVKGIKNCEIIFEKEVIEAKDCKQLFSNEEEKLYNLLILCSTKIIENQKEDFLSLELFEYCGKNFYSNQNELLSDFQSFIHRTFDDFKLLSHCELGQIKLNLDFDANSLVDERRRLAYFLRNHIENCVQDFDNPISLLILYNFVKEIILDEKRAVLILEKFIETVKKRQQYNLIKLYWFGIAGDMFDSEDISTFQKENNSFYRKLSIESLNNLMFLFERNGFFNESMKIAKYLYMINPKKYGIDICSLYERMGNYDEAKKYININGLLNSVTSKPTDLEIKYLQRKSWIIVSCRDEKLKNEGFESLNSYEKLLTSHNFDNEALWLWHFYNIKANYCEWNEKYVEAIENYKMCLNVPTLGGFEYGATFLNMSIAYRFKFIESDFKDLESIEKSIEMGEIGCKLKSEVGDRDEMPVVLHNHALNILHKELITNSNENLQKVIKLTKEGVSILDSTNSNKRLALLLFEYCIASRLLGDENIEFERRLKELYVELDENEKNQIKAIFKRFSTKYELKNLEYIDV